MSRLGVILFAGHQAVHLWLRSNLALPSLNIRPGQEGKGLIVLIVTDETVLP